jgi:DNA-binding response OmpR family regulator
MYPAQRDEPAVAHAMPKLRVLVVDDEPDTVKMLLALLRSEGHEARGHASGQAAVHALKEFLPDVIISDIVMPGVSGWAVASEVRKVMGDKRPLLIAITGQYSASAEKVLSHVTAFDFYLTKPADPNVLLALVANGVKRAD